MKTTVAGVSVFQISGDYESLSIFKLLNDTQTRIVIIIINHF